MTIQRDIPEEPINILQNITNYERWLFRLYRFLQKIRNNYEYVIQESTDYTALPIDCVIEMDATAGNRTVTLPAQTDIPIGKKYIIVKTDVSANTVTIATADSANVNTTVTVPLATQHAVIVLIANGTDFIGY